MTKWFNCQIMPVKCLIRYSLVSMKISKGIILIALCWVQGMLLAQTHTYERWIPYRTFIDSLVQAHSLPSHYAYLPLLQTDCDVHFHNSYGSGAWGLGVAAARHYGLRVLPGYDERHNMQLCSEAAVRYLTDLYTHYGGDSEKTLLQFMKCTPGVICEESFSVDYKLRCLADGCARQPEVSDTNPHTAIVLAESVRLSDFCRLITIDSTVLMACNPSIRPKARFLHASSHIYLPKEKIDVFNSMRDSLYATAVTRKEIQVTVPSTAPKPEPTYVVYRVKSGDTLGHIALRYHVGVSQLKRWNRLHTDMLQIGQRLKIYR